MKALSILLVVFTLALNLAPVSAQQIIYASNTYDGKSDDMNIIMEEDIQNEFMIEMKQREGYFKFLNDLYPPAPSENVQMPVEMRTFEFMGERFLNDPDEYYSN